MRFHAVYDLTDTGGSAKVPLELASKKWAGPELAYHTYRRRTGEHESYQTLGRSHLHCELWRRSKAPVILSRDGGSDWRPTHPEAAKWSRCRCPWLF